MIKKLISLIVLAFFFLTQSVVADVVDSNNPWSYSFHLEYSNNTLSPANDPYTPLPMLYVASQAPNTTDYYGVVISVHAKELGRFGFNTPQTTVAALGKSIFDVSAPFFADADHVGFFTQKGNHLFDISVKGSSFCNDNNTCNSDIGEDHANCPNDCPLPPEVRTPGTLLVTPTTQVEQSTTTTPEVTSANPTPVMEGTIITPPLTAPETTFSKTTITLVVLGLIFLVLIFVLWKLRGFMEE